MESLRQQFTLCSICMERMSTSLSHITDKVYIILCNTSACVLLTYLIEETPLDRELQAKELARIMSSVYPEPVIFLGYVVTKPHAPRRKLLSANGYIISNVEPAAPYDIMVTDGQVHDIDKDDWDRWCEYIFYRGLYRTAYARVSRSTITDTELQIGQFVLPKHGTSVTNDTTEGQYLRAWKEEMPVDQVGSSTSHRNARPFLTVRQWFPQEYYPEVGGVRGHFYHVFNTVGGPQFE